MGGHIEITVAKAKTRARRLVEVCPALAAWLDLFRNCAGKVWINNERVCTRRNENQFHEELSDVCEQGGVTRKPNGLRNAFCSYHFALQANENATTQQAGNSPAMIHSHYKGLATNPEAEAWFSVAPAKADNVIAMTAATATK